MSNRSHVRAEADNKLPANWKTVLRVQLRNLVKSGKLVKPPGKNAYKLGESLKKAPKKKAVSNPALPQQPFDVHPATRPLPSGWLVLLPPFLFGSPI